MFTESPDLYDAIYSTFKDYAAESKAIADLVRSVHPGARTILDVGCGTGEHIRHLRSAHGFLVDGLDLDRALLAVVRQKVPDAHFFEGDMSSFDVPHRYDVVMCLFSSIGYMRTLDGVAAALRHFRDHLATGGVVIVEPWFAPGVLRVGAGFLREATAGDVRVTRTSQTTVEGRLSTIIFEYRIEDAAGTRNAREVHELGLFTPDEMLACFRAAGLAATHDPVGLTDRGLYVARVTAPAIRAATLADVPALARLRAETWGTEEYWQERMAGYMRGELHPQHALGKRAVYVAVEQGGVVGLIAGHLTRRFECDGELEWLDVTSTRRGSGIAAALLQELAAWFKAHGAKRVCVDVDPENAPAQAFYRRHEAEDLQPHWLVWSDITTLTPTPH